MSAKQALTNKEAWFLRLMDEYAASGGALEDFLRAHPEIDPEMGALLRLTDELGAMPSPPVEAAFRRNARLRLLNRAAAGRSRTPARRENGNGLVFALKRVLVGLALVVGLFTLAGAGTLPMQAALPGDFLYPGKLALEEMQLLSAPPGEDAILSIRFASNRLTEIQLLIVQGRHADVETAVAAFEDNINRAVLALAEVARSDGGSTYPIMLQIENEMSHYSHTLGELLAFVPADTQMALTRAIEASMVWTPQSN